MPGTKDDYNNYLYKKADRKNLPTSEMADGVRNLGTERYTAPRREGADPQLAWDRRWDPAAEVEHRPLFIQEKIHPGALIQSLRTVENSSDKNLALFSDFNGLTGEQYTEWYKHKARWQNRLIHGNAMEVCASLAAREGLEGKVQAIYFDPPYGINYKSNFAAKAGEPGGKEGKEQVNADPSSVKAFLDTWEDGIHSYLDAIHKHARMAHALLAETGSFFTQIGNENMMRVGMVLDEVFGAQNRMAIITFVKSGSKSSTTLPQVSDYVLWYAKDGKQLKEQEKAVHIYEELESPLEQMMLELPGGGAKTKKRRKRKREVA